MKDKEKQIEEMASDMDYGCTKRDLYPSDAKKNAKALYLLNYRKLPENAFILTEDNAEELANLIVTSPQMQSVMSDLIKAWEKETAEKLIVKIKQFLSNVETVRGDNKNKLQPEIGYKCSEVDDFLDEIEKQLSVEI